MDARNSTTARPLDAGLVVGDVVVCLAAAAAWAWHNAAPGPWPSPHAVMVSSGLGWAACLDVFIIVAVGAALLRCGHHSGRLPRSVEARQVLGGVGAGLIAANLVALAASGALLPWWDQVIWLACIPAILAVRGAIRFGQGIARRNGPAKAPRPGVPVQLDIPATWVGEHALCQFPSFTADRAYPVSLVLKGALDFTVAALLVALLLPVFIAIALYVRADGGPMFFSHTRVGRGGRRFRCLKFRTMVRDADAVLRAHLQDHPEAAKEWAQTRKLTVDPRVTPIGSFLRKTSLDELPQLVNVLRGEMSLVGPRPIVDDEVERYADDIAFYYATRPGMTGLWQISGRSRTSYARRVQLDVWYVRHWSFAKDLLILIKTIPAVLQRDGAV